MMLGDVESGKYYHYKYIPTGYEIVFLCIENTGIEIEGVDVFAIDALDEPYKPGERFIFHIEEIDKTSSAEVNEISKESHPEYFL